MPCLFLRGVSETVVFQPYIVKKLYQKIADAVGLDVSHIEVHIETTQYCILRPDGSLIPAPDVHVFVEWTGRPFETKVSVAEAIHEFLRAHDLHSDITFRDSPAGTFFLDGVLVGPVPQEPQEVELL